MKDELLWLIFALPSLTKFGTKYQKCRSTGGSHGEGITASSPSDPQITQFIWCSKQHKSNGNKYAFI